MSNVLMPSPRQRYFNNNGTVASGCLLYTYAAGTSTPQTTWSDLDGTVPNSNPIILDSNGEAVIYWSGAYKVDLKTAVGVQITGYPVDNYVTDGLDAKPMANYTALRAYTGTATGIHITKPGLAGVFERSLTDTTSADNGGTIIVDASYRRWKRVYDFVLNLKWFGATGDGVTDDTASIQSCINALGLYGGMIFAQKGKYLLTERLIISSVKTISIHGESNGINDPINQPTTFYTKTLADYVFSYTGIDQELELSGVAFDGSNGTSTPSSVWKGVITTSLVANHACFFKMSNVSAGGSNSPTPCFDLTHAFTDYFSDCNFGYWGGHVQFAFGGTYASTTHRFRNCRFHYAKQNIQVLPNVSDIYFDSCIFESSTVVFAGAFVHALFLGCYFENIGYDPSITGSTQGITPRNILGVSYSTAISSTVTSPIYVQYGKVSMIDCHYAYLAAAPAAMTSWVDGIGRGSSLGAGGIYNIINPSFNATLPFFRLDDEAQSAKEGFIYNYESQSSSAPYIVYNDVRLISRGSGTLAMASGAFWRISIESGKIIVDSIAGQISSPSSTNYPGDGSWLLGDKIKLAKIAGGAEILECFTAGTSSSRWGAFGIIPKKLSASVESAGTTTFTVPVPEIIGDNVDILITATTDNTSLVYKAIVTFVKLPSSNGSSNNSVMFSDANTAATTIVASSTSSTSTITLINSNAGTVNYYFSVIGRS